MSPLVGSTSGGSDLLVPSGSVAFRSRAARLVFSLSWPKKKEQSCLALQILPFWTLNVSSVTTAFSVYNALPCIVRAHVFGPYFQEKNLSF